MNEYHEYRGNIHMHTTFSDGAGEPDALIESAARAGLDFIIITDHNVLVDQTREGWQNGVLTLFDIEVNDVNLRPEANHCLTLNVQEDVTRFASDPQQLIDAVRERGGLTFLAHPIDKPSPLIPDIYPWNAWDIEGFTGLEIWNFMSEFRPYVTSKRMAIVMAFFPQLFSTGPYPEMLAKWDEWLQRRPTVAIGGSDAHARVFNLGVLRRRFLPYEYCFRAVNMHILTPEPFQKNLARDREMLYEALSVGRCWLGYDMLHATEGFRFVAHSAHRVHHMGDQISLDGPVIFEITTPATAHIRLIRAGTGVVAETQGRSLTHETSHPGAYRVEVWKRRWFKSRGWIFSNPIYLNSHVT
ncbi:MAG: CehA/McbA family metallohydrolase [Chloroflexi bacterium]|nr:CehA/McbA family metallohydrolase [Chloroflexota bacterium]